MGSDLALSSLRDPSLGTGARGDLAGHLESRYPEVALKTTMERVWPAFAFANEPLVLHSVTAYTHDEFDRVVAGG
jgi:hypothetical protein